MNRACIEWIFGFPDTQESGSLFINLFTQAGNIFKLFACFEHPVFIAVFNNFSSKHRSNTRHIRKQLLTCRVKLHSYFIHTTLHYTFEAFLQHSLVYIMLVLPYAYRFGVNFNKFRERIHQATTYRN